MRCLSLASGAPVARTPTVLTPAVAPSSVPRLLQLQGEPNMASFDSVSSPVSSPQASPQARRLASEQILQSLVDGLLVEGILEIASLAKRSAW
mgnify:CR=1 FL=1